MMVPMFISLCIMRTETWCCLVNEWRAVSSWGQTKDWPSSKHSFYLARSLRFETDCWTWIAVFPELRRPLFNQSVFIYHQLHVGHPSPGLPWLMPDYWLLGSCTGYHFASTKEVFFSFPWFVFSRVSIWTIQSNLLINSLPLPQIHTSAFTFFPNCLLNTSTRWSENL